MILTTLRPLTNPERRAAWAARYYQQLEPAQLETTAMQTSNVLEFPNRGGRVSHILIGINARNLRAELTRLVSDWQADNLVALFKLLAERYGCESASKTIMRRANEHARRQGVRS
jgi:hypothetical protein